MKMKIPRAPGWHIVFATAGLYNLLVNRDWIGTSVCAALFLGAIALRRKAKPAT